MYIGVARLAVHLGRCNSPLLQNGSRQMPVVCGIPCTQNRKLRSVANGEKIVRPEPYPYTKRPGFNPVSTIWDNTVFRFNENTKVIVVDGNLAVGKKKFAQKLAEEFDMKYFPEVTERDVYNVKGNDLRKLNQKLPPDLQMYSLEHIYKETNPTLGLQAGMLQMELYSHKYHNYLDAFEHLLSTGQGVVMERGVFSDYVFADALRSIGFFTKQGKKHYDEYNANSISELFKPHLVIYLDAPVKVVRELIKKRGVEYEVNGRNLTDEYLQSIEDSYKTKYLPFMRRHAEVVTYDVTNLPDWDFVVDDLLALDLDQDANLDEVHKFGLWHTAKTGNLWSRYRFWLSGKRPGPNKFLRAPADPDCPELFLNKDQWKEIQRIVDANPEDKKAFAGKFSFFG